MVYYEYYLQEGNLQEPIFMKTLRVLIGLIILVVVLIVIFRIEPKTAASPELVSEAEILEEIPLDVSPESVGLPETIEDLLEEPFGGVLDFEGDQLGSESEVTEYGALVEYTLDGFSPDSVTLQVGEKILFSDLVNGDMWVASAPHPIHTDYVEFNQGGVGLEYLFTFSEPGTYYYHNHKQPENQGVILVQ